MQDRILRDVDRKGILSGVDKIIDDALRVESIGKAPYYQHKTACDQLHRVPRKNFAANLLTKIYDQIENNWEGRLRKKSPSKQNWRFQQNKKVDKNPSLEVQLERAIVNINQDMWPDAKNWANQVPTASGLWDHKCDKRRAIDLVHVSPGQNNYDTVEFIELKVNRSAGHPVYAAIEVLLYGMLYVFSRRRLKELEYDLTKQPLLQAKAIHLVVLAPFEYYFAYRFERLEKEITTELARFIGKSEGYTMDFQSQAFLSGCPIKKTISDKALLIEALKGREGVEAIRQQWWDEAKRLECETGGGLAVPRSWAEKSKTKRTQPRRASAKGQAK